MIIIRIVANVLGEFGIVYKGRLKSGFADKSSEAVAVKTLKGTSNNLYCSMDTLYENYSCTLVLTWLQLPTLCFEGSNVRICFCRVCAKGVDKGSLTRVWEDVPV